MKPSFSPEIFENYFRNSKDLLCFMSAEGVFTALNPQWEQSLGYSLSDMNGKHYADFIHPEDKELAHKTILKQQTFINRYLHKNGSYRWLKWQTFPSSEGIFASACDITENITLKPDGKEVERFSKAFFQIPYIVTISDFHTGRYTYVNKLFQSITGYNNDDILGKTSTEMNLWVDDTHKEMVLASLKRDLPVREFETKFRTRSGKTIDCIVNANVIAINQEKSYLFFVRDITELREAENALEESELRLLDIYKLIPNVLGFTRLSDATILDANPEMTRLTGFTRDEYIDQSVIDLGIWAKPEERDRMFKLLKDKGEVKNFEFSMQEKSGRIRICLISAVPQSYNNDDCLLWVITDIDKYKKIENELKESEARLRSFINESSGGILIINESGLLEEWNKAAETITGIPRKDALDHSWWNVISPCYPPELRNDEAHTRIEKSIQQILKTGHLTIPSNSTYVLQTSEGVKYIEQNLFAIKSQGGYRLAALFDDITERRKIEEKLKESEERYRIITQLSGYAIFDFDVEKQQYIWTGAVEDITSYTLQEFSRFSFSQLLQITHPDDREFMSKQFADSIANIKPIHAQYRMLRKNKEYIWLELKAFIFTDGKNKAYRLLGIISNISDRKNAEKAIRELNTELEARVHERTTQLEQANKDLEAFSYSVSHDLRAPIRHIDGFVRLLYSNINNPNENITNFYTKIRFASGRMSSMIDELLTFSRLGRKELAVAPVDLNVLISEIIEQLKPDYVQRNIEWRTGKLPVIHGDRELLKFAFENMISNAIKYTSKKPIALIQVDARKTSENQVIIRIKDNGAGFDMKYQEKLFGVFQRLHSNEEFEGIGIGLANVKQIITRHKGTVHAEGKVNEGATFYITLPRL
jgi:PAS domain S-box-containing protein